MLDQILFMQEEGPDRCAAVAIGVHLLRQEGERNQRLAMPLRRVA